MNYYWCHGPNRHTYRTQDRVRGSKGSKVIRTRKIRQDTDRSWYDPKHASNYFCSQSCQGEFWAEYGNQIRQIAPRHEPLETPIEDPVKTVHTADYTYSDGTRHSWITTDINLKGVDTAE